MTGDSNKMKDLSTKYALNDIINEFLDVRDAQATDMSETNTQTPAAKPNTSSDIER
tara:strand:+ start:1639 stop:1806 length:168 start_codon:yes stop_codon:yes gene_type:complete